MIKAVFSREIEHSKKLAQQARALLTSIFIREAVHPIFSLFTTAFLWRENQDFFSVAVYTLAFFALIPFGFYINGLLLRFLTPSFLYTAGMISSGAVVASLIFTHATSVPFLILFGAAWGITSGLYWANRNFVELHFVANEHRNYFFGITNAAIPILNVVTPLCIGWLIILVEFSGALSVRAGYQILALVGLCGLLISGRILRRHDQAIPRVSVIFSRFKNRLWRDMRIATFFIGFINGASLFLTPLIILHLVGKEGALGTVTAVSSIIGALAVYIIGRRSVPRHRFLQVGISIGILTLGAALFSYYYSAGGAIFYNVAAGLYTMLFFGSFNPIFYTAVEQDTERSGGSAYARICDREIFLNLGRVLGIILFIVMLDIFSNDAALRYSPLILAALQLPLLYLVPRIVREENVA